MVFVNKDVAIGGAEFVAMATSFELGPPDEIGIVSAALLIEDIEILVEECSSTDQLRMAAVKTQASKLTPIKPSLTNATEHLLHVCRKPSGGQRWA